MFKRSLSYAVAMIAAVALISVCASALGASLASASTPARAVSLSDARIAPDMLRILPAGHAATFLRQCPRGHYFTETSAYRWNGRALSGQRWNADRTLTYWRARHGRVTFDGLTFHNGTRAAVLVAGWCG